MKKYLLMAVLSLSSFAFGDEITFSFVNLSNATFSASASELQFANAVNVLVTDNSNGKSMTLTALDSGNTGTSTRFAAGPPLEADYLGSGANSALVAASGHVFLSGTMEDSGRLEAAYPDKPGAFLSRFLVTTVDPAILAELGTGPRWAPEGSVSLTLAETSFDGTTLTATLGGGEFTITTEAAVPETATLLLFGTGLLMTMAGAKRYWP